MPVKMDLTSKLKQEFVIERINALSQQQLEGPLVVELDTTEACDLACPGCISQDIMVTNNRFSNDRLMSIAEELNHSGVKAVILIGGGEPLAHPAVGQLIEYFGQNDIHVGITTNGTFIRKHWKPISEYASWTRVSVDAATDEMFNILRPSKVGKSKFHFIIDNMRMLAEIKQGTLGFSFLIQTEADGPGLVSNVHEIYAAAELARDIGCDYFEVKPSYQFREDSNHALMIHRKDLMNQAKEQVSCLDELETDNFTILKAINLDHSLDGVVQEQPKSYTHCPVSELRTLVCPSGTYVCPYWRGKERMNIGDLHEQSFSEMWHGQRRKDTMASLDPSKDCSFHCLRHDSNVELLSMMNSDQASRLSSIPEFDRFI
ncbi:MAG: radical SAM protein [Granulosicoccus sp.]|nr:radical SAM protein [Granulosicoccus sp.]